VAAGGCASPSLGSDGSGFEIMKSFGHKVSALQPALVQLKTNPNEVKSLKGIKINGKVSVLENGEVIAVESGEVLFTDYGVSGPPVFQLSAAVPFRKNLEISIDLVPEYNLKAVYDILEERKFNLSHLTMEDFFVGFMNKRIGNLISRRIGIEKLSYPVSSLNKKQLWAIAEQLKSYRLEITGTNGFKNAQVTAGGVYTDQIDKHTMQSKIVKGLYCCGEVLDIYGDCGGYNLQWAWSSGFLAGRSASL
jgi:predicted Rossmann fold flavoprotein